MTYELYYWTGIQGRGEYIRLALEAAGAPYRDVAREEGDGILSKVSREVATPSFAPPFLRDGDVVVGQVAAILLYLGDKLDLAPREPRLRLWTHQIQLTIADFVLEGHDVHHPIGAGEYYENQKPESLRRAAEFRAQRVPKFLDWFEGILARNPEGQTHLVGDRLSYADLSLFQVMDGLAYAFPVLMDGLYPRYPKIKALCAAVAGHSRISAYLASDRRLPGNESDLFRHYPELDARA
ncbi:glutathione S-transferase [Shinella yambaruensis]|uniref:Glutathione S-transferase n=1 Tax=Shinella yambaruensis TaxID=415996 RepID=A0ABQ5ZMS5_9HYPH|nr:glutathione S-transferase [Shinella yambaruensis]MCJ8025676.1 glutathione S-transferase [Shinella yambaruensis]MCU7979584.1 glutathione S-transferase [Shinella yambaruensis]GLR53044.1 glutathione S-transferase [Shinella yambaruensis]